MMSGEPEPPNVGNPSPESESVSGFADLHNLYPLRTLLKPVNCGYVVLYFLMRGPGVVPHLPVS
jgi:hypothetical protein